MGFLDYVWLFLSVGILWLLMIYVVSIDMFGIASSSELAIILLRLGFIVIFVYSIFYVNAGINRIEEMEGKRKRKRR